MKTCSICKEIKDDSCFYRNSDPRYKMPLKSACIDCTKVQRKKYEHTESHRQKRKEYRKANLEKLNQQQRDRSRWKRANVVGWAERDRERARKSRNGEAQQRRYASIDYRIRQVMSSSMRRSIKKNKNSWKTLVPYTLEELKRHISSLFSDGMTWENYGEWHIDHIRPVVSFNITSFECQDFKECWALQNLQPLWGKDNMSKGSLFRGQRWKRGLCQFKTRISLTL